MSKTKNPAPAAEKETPAPVQGVLELPYEPLTNVAGRKTLREVATVGRQTAYIDIDYVVVRGSYEIHQGFNPRFKPEGMSMDEWLEILCIEELAMDMLENGQADALEGDMLADGTFVLTDGFRRKLGIQWLLKKGYTHYLNTPEGKEPRSIRKVEIIPNPISWTEEDRLVRALSSNNNLKYKPIEIAIKLKMWKDVFGRTNQQLAKRLGKSRQYVDNMLTLSEEPESIQQAIAKGDITPTAALSLQQTEKDPAKREEIIKDAISSGQGLSVKDAAAHKSEFHDYKERMATVKDQYAEGVISYTAAITEVKEIAENASKAKADNKNSIDFALKSIIEMIDDTEVEEETEDNIKQYDFTMAEIVLSVQMDITPAEEAKVMCNKLRDEAVKLFPGKLDHIDFCLLRYVACIHHFQQGDNIPTFFDIEEENTKILDDLKANKNAFMAVDYAVTKCRINNIIAARLFPDNIMDHDIALDKAIAAIAEISAGIIKTDTKTAILVEEESRKTSAKQEVHRPKEQKQDALGPIDFTKDKVEGEMELNEAIKLGDKMIKNLDSLPAHMKQYKDDWQGLVRLQQSKIQNALDILKKASDTR